MSRPSPQLPQRRGVRHTRKSRPKFTPSKSTGPGLRSRELAAATMPRQEFPAAVENVPAWQAKFPARGRITSPCAAVRHSPALFALPPTTKSAGEIIRSRSTPSCSVAARAAFFVLASHGARVASRWYLRAWPRLLAIWSRQVVGVPPHRAVNVTPRWPGTRSTFDGLCVRAATGLLRRAWLPRSLMPPHQWGTGVPPPRNYRLEFLASKNATPSPRLA